jgi:hypothetical protein
MSEMIERVARAIAKSSYEDEQTPATASEIGEYVDAFWPNFTDAARAAIEATREPTEAMKQAGSAAAYRAGHMEEDDEFPIEFHRGMIDGALAEPPK